MWHLTIISIKFEYINRNCMITCSDFDKIDIRTGTIIEVNDFPKAKKPLINSK